MSGWQETPLGPPLSRCHPVVVIANRPPPGQYTPLDAFAVSSGINGIDVAPVCHRRRPDGFVKPPAVQYADHPEGKIAYQVVGDGPVDLMWFPYVGSLDGLWDFPPLERFLRRLASFSRLILYKRPGFAYFPFLHDAEAVLEEIQAFLTGARGAPDIDDRILATVLLTDIVGSTERAADLGDRRWRHVLDDHDSVALREIERFRGRLVKSTGDGLLATFDGPARATRCAMALADAARHVGVEIRAGLHTGEVEVRGDDVSGIAVHIAERVMAEAGPSEVLVSEAVPRLVAGSGLEFQDRGARKLKGVPGEWRLFAVTA